MRHSEVDHSMCVWDPHMAGQIGAAHLPLDALKVCKDLLAAARPL